jgi:pantoate--beta-alanine ligase
MDIIESPHEMTAWAESVKAKGETIALVPTMGFFHEGHLSLMRMAAQNADHVVVSLFVNPIQFGPGEDLEKYPKNFANDSTLAEQQGVAVLFVPQADKMYPEGFCSSVLVDTITDCLCGQSRPGHFKGVTTVVAKLFNIVQPNCAVFGEKDFQQLTVIQRMVKDLNWNIRIIPHPIVREEDGLAMSSRNSYLSREERQTALYIYKSICLAEELARQGVKETAVVLEKLTSFLDNVDGLTIEYISFVDAENLKDVLTIDSDTVLALAARVGTTRLIDNTRLLN